MRTTTRLSLLPPLLFFAAGLPAQKAGGTGGSPPPAPAIAFADSGIKVMNADGTNVRTVVSLRRGEAATGPVWSPDGQQLALTAVLGGQQGLWKVNLDGTGRQFLAPQLVPTQMGVIYPEKDWSRVVAPDGRAKIAFLSDGVDGFADVFVVNTDGTGLQNLTNSPEQEMSATWTRNGQGLYVGWTDFNNLAGPEFDAGGRLLQLAAVPGGGVAVANVVSTLDAWDVRQCAAAHGSDRVLVRGLPTADPGSTAQLYVVDDATVLPWTPRLLDGSGEVFRVPSFSPDDQRIVFLRVYSPANGICVANADGSSPVRIRSAGDWPAWRHN